MSESEMKDSVIMAVMVLTHLPDERSLYIKKKREKIEEKAF